MIAGSRVLSCKSLISSKLAMVGFLEAVSKTFKISWLRVTVTLRAIQVESHPRMFSAVSLSKVLVTVVIPE